MIKMLPVFLLALVVHAGANPVANRQMEKVSERCLIEVGEASASVSCGVVYHDLEKGQAGLTFAVTVPVFCRAGDAETKEQAVALAERSHIRMEIGGKIYKPVFAYKSLITGLKLPEGIGLFDCEFLVDAPTISSFPVVVSYEQELLNGVAYYLPLFEKGKSPEKDKEAFTISFFPDLEHTLELETQHPDRSSVMKTRVTVHPKDREWIAVKKATEKASGRTH